MKKILFALPLVALLGAIYWYMHTPEYLRSQEIKKSLQEWSEAVTSQNREAISTMLRAKLSDDAKIKLNVEFVFMMQPSGKPMVQEMSKEEFITFIDNVLYSVHDYQQLLTLDSIVLNGSASVAGVKLKSNEQAKGNSYFGGTQVASHYVGRSECNGTVSFETTPLLKSLDCTTKLSTALDPSELSKVKSSDVLQEMLGGRKL